MDDGVTSTTSWSITGQCSNSPYTGEEGGRGEEFEEGREGGRRERKVRERREEEGGGRERKVREGREGGEGKYRSSKAGDQGVY